MLSLLTSYLLFALVYSTGASKSSTSDTIPIANDENSDLAEVGSNIFRLFVSKCYINL